MSAKFLDSATTATCKCSYTIHYRNRKDTLKRKNVMLTIIINEKA